MEWIDDIHCLLKRFVTETDELITINFCFLKCIDILREFKSVIMKIEMIMMMIIIIMMIIMMMITVMTEMVFEMIRVVEMMMEVVINIGALKLRGW
jgi:hypothetical protein